jgi:hypothetical protein
VVVSTHDGVDSRAARHIAAIIQSVFVTLPYQTATDGLVIEL